MAHPIKVCVTGAAGQIAYSLIPLIASGRVFGENQSLVLSLLEVPSAMELLSGVCMEMEDCGYPLVQEVIHTDNTSDAFKDIDAAFLVGSAPRKEGMNRRDLLSCNVKIFKTQGQALDSVAKKSAKVLMVANPANTNAWVCSSYSPSIPKENVSCLTRLDQNRALSQIASRLGVAVSAVKNVVIWGNHSATQFPDADHGTVTVGGKDTPIPLAVSDDHYIKNQFITAVQTRGEAVIKARKLSSAMSAAKASADHMRDWWCGTDGRWVSMGVVSKGEYGVPEGLVYSFPVTIDASRTWTVVQGLTISHFARQRMDLTAQELIEEREAAQTLCQQ